LGKEATRCPPLRRLGTPPELADDLHQGTFRIVLERLRRSGLDAPAGLAGFLLDEEAAIVRRLIGELPTARDRQLLLRFYVAEEEKESIGADLGLDSLHFNRVLFRARQRAARSAQAWPPAADRSPPAASPSASCRPPDRLLAGEIAGPPATVVRRQALTTKGARPCRR
jgi:hypothetical protein